MGRRKKIESEMMMKGTRKKIDSEMMKGRRKKIDSEMMTTMERRSTIQSEMTMMMMKGIRGKKIEIQSEPEMMMKGRRRRKKTETESESESEKKKKKKAEEESLKLLVCKKEEDDKKGEGDKEEEEEEDEGKRFYACYLLTSLSPRHKGATYIGFTVNPRRRIRQHNGQIGGGARTTTTTRPWEMVLCIHGFPTNVSALQFEWAWQHPMQSLAVRQAAANFKSLSGIANKIKVAYTMLTLPAWQSLNLTINFFSTKYTKHSSGCPCLPEQMKVQVRPMDELPCYMEGEDCLHYNEDETDGEYECNEEESANDFTKEGSANVTLDFFADCHDSIETQSREQGGIEENGIKQQLLDSLSSKEDHRDPSQLIESPVKKLASVASSSSTGETAKDWGFIEEYSIDLDQTIEKRSTISDNIKDQPGENTDQNGTRQPWDSPTSKEDSRYSFQFIESPLKQLASLATFSSTEDTTKDWGFINEYSIDLDQPISDDIKDQPAVITEETAKEEIFGSIEGNSNELGQPTRKRSPLITGDDKGQPAIIFTASREVEVIDVLTPSPDCRISLWSKKRRVCAEIIDLTKSPAFVQL